MTDPLLTPAHDALVEARAAILAELAAYPTPVSGCDVQYTHLLSLRAAVTEALGALAQKRFYPTPRIQTPGARVETR
ncbi:MAG: hypothetical protein ACU0CI_03620 [Shimia sp.]